MVGLGGRGPRLTSHSAIQPFILLAISLFLQFHHSAIYSNSFNSSILLTIILHFLHINYAYHFLQTLANHFFHSYIYYISHKSLFHIPTFSHSTILYLLYSLPILHSLYPYQHILCIYLTTKDIELPI